MRKYSLFVSVAVVICFILTGCKVGTGTALFSEKREILNYTEKSEVSSIAILNGAGKIRVTESSSDNVEVVCNVEYSGTSKTDFEKKIKTLVLTPQTINDTLYFEAVADMENRTNYWEWLDHNINTDYVKINYEIKVPKYIGCIRIMNVVGDTNVNDIACELYLRTYVGNIKCSAVSPVITSNIAISTGNIDFSAADISKAQTIMNGVGVGNIVCALPKDVAYKTDNTIVPDTSFSVDRKNMFSTNVIQQYREMLTQPLEITDNSGNETIVGNAADFGSITIK